MTKGPPKSHVTVMLEEAMKKLGPTFSFEELFANSNLNEASRKAAVFSFQHIKQVGGIARVGTSRPARYRIAVKTQDKCSDAATHQIDSRQILSTQNMGWLAEPARAGALDFLACPSLMDGKLVPRRPPHQWDGHRSVRHQSHRAE